MPFTYHIIDHEGEEGRVLSSYTQEKRREEKRRGEFLQPRVKGIFTPMKIGVKSIPL
jgi:hypothetical protein